MMRILMVSPHPTYSPRGTPISVLNRCRALSALGHEVDLVTYGIGEDVPVPGLRYLRAPVPGIRQVKVGPSAAKLPLNAAVFARTLAVLLRRRSRYDVLHTHEEAGPFGAVISRVFRLPHVYDMGNDLDVVLGNYGLGAGHPLRRIARSVESGTIRSADVVVAHFPSLAARVRDVDPNTHCEVAFNVPLVAHVRDDLVTHYRNAWGLEGKAAVVYTGTLETYQGIDNLLDAVAVGARNFKLVLIGGSPVQQETLRTRVSTEGLADDVLVVGQLPSEHIPSCLAAADILVSPRATGTNTPLKIFEYMHSGRPIVATRIPSHTAVLDDEVSILTGPEPEQLAAGLAMAVNGGAAIAAKGLAAASRAIEQYGALGYLRAVASAYSRIAGFPAAESINFDAARARLAGQSDGPHTVVIPDPNSATLSNR
ncbi:MAG TPA: glycosyltransferase [Acidothermaceae bacterium]